MIVNLILFNRGCGGNFLARVLTLDPSTVCLGKENFNTPAERCEYYCYQDSAVPFNTPAGNGLSVWVDKELNYFYFPFTRGFEELLQLNQTVIEPIHPDHYNNKLQLLGQDDSVFLYYIDPAGCDTWVLNQIKHKISLSATQPKHNALSDILNSTAAQPISLNQILHSETTFVDEYIKICNNMKLNSYPDLALRIYRTWKKTWG